MYIPDPIELGEMRAERWLDEYERGQPRGMWKCSCGRVAPEQDFDMPPGNVDPWGAPVCPTCCKGRGEPTPPE